MEMQQEVKLELLTQDSVSILFINYIEIEGEKVQIGQNTRTAYVNSEKGREDLESQIKNPYLSAILAIWGDTPTVIINEFETRKIY